MKNIVMVGAKRSPYGLVSSEKNSAGFFGTLKDDVTPIDLASQVLRQAVKDLGPATEHVSLVRLGCHLAQKQEPAMRQAPAKILTRTVKEITCANAATFDSACASGFAALEDVIKEITLERAEIGIVVGLDMTSRYRKESVEAILRDPETGKMTWHLADETAKQYGFSREEMDEYTLLRLERTLVHVNDYLSRIVPISGLLYRDEVSDSIPLSRIKKWPLMPGCELITALHLCRNADGAGVVALASEETANKYGLPILARVLSSSSVKSDPSDFTIVGRQAMTKAIKKSGLSEREIDIFLVEETSVISALLPTFGFSRRKINPWGSNGHPFGATPIMSLVSLLTILEKENKRYGVVGIGATGSIGSAVVIERL